MAKKKKSAAEGRLNEVIKAIHWAGYQIVTTDQPSEPFAYAVAPAGSIWPHTVCYGDHVGLIASFVETGSGSPAKIVSHFIQRFDRMVPPFWQTPGEGEQARPEAAHQNAHDGDAGTGPSDPPTRATVEGCGTINDEVYFRVLITHPAYTPEALKKKLLSGELCLSYGEDILYDRSGEIVGEVDWDEIESGFDVNDAEIVQDEQPSGGEA